MPVEMRRQREQEARITAPSAGAPAALDQARSTAEKLLSATDDALARALSGDAERFLADCRQQGGQ